MSLSQREKRFSRELFSAEDNEREEAEEAGQGEIDEGFAQFVRDEDHTWEVSDLKTKAPFMADTSAKEMDTLTTILFDMTSLEKRRNIMKEIGEIYWNMTYFNVF